MLSRGFGKARAQISCARPPAGSRSWQQKQQPIRSRSPRNSTTNDEHSADLNRVVFSSKSRMWNDWNALRFRNSSRLRTPKLSLKRKKRLPSETTTLLSLIFVHTIISCLLKKASWWSVTSARHETGPSVMYVNFYNNVTIVLDRWLPKARAQWDSNNKRARHA